MTESPASPRHSFPDIPKDLEAVCLKCLEKDPAKRYQTATELAEDLGRVREGTATVARPLGNAKRVIRAISEKYLIASIVFVILLIAIAYYVLSGNTVESDTAAFERRHREFVDALKNGNEITVIGDRGLPLWYRNEIGDVTIKTSPIHENATFLQTHGLSFLTLFDNPIGENYEFHAQLKHVHGNRSSSRIGVFVGLKEISSDWTNNRTHGVVFVEYSEFYLASEISEPGMKEKHRAQFVVGALAQGTNRSPGFISGVEYDNLRFVPVEREPQPWRNLVVAVSTNDVAAYWVNDGGKRDLIGKVPIGKVEYEWNKVSTKANAGDRLSVNWSYQLPVGIWAYDSDLAVRNAKIVPIPR